MEGIVGYAMLDPAPVAFLTVFIAVRNIGFHDRRISYQKKIFQLQTMIQGHTSGPFRACR